MVSFCFKHKANTAKCLIFLVSLLIVILVALAIVLVRRKDHSVCNSEHCLKISEEILRYVDKSQNPCEDFHAFSCGRYAKNRKDFPKIQPEDEMNFLIKEPVFLNDTKPLIMQKFFYHSCANLGAIDIDNDETILDIFYGLGQWPVLKGANWSGIHFDWTKVAKSSRRLGLKIDWFLDFSVVKDFNDTRTHVLQIDVPTSLKPLRTEEIALKKKLFTDVSVMMGGPKYLTHYETGKAIEFEDALGIIAERQRGRSRDQNYATLPKLTINEVQLMWPNIQWLDLINNITGNRMSGSDWVIFHILEYVEELNKLIYSTPKRAVADYMLWKIIEDIWPFLTQPIRDKFQQFELKAYRTQPDYDRQKFCADKSKEEFPLIIESVYIRRHVTEEKRQLVREMLVVIQNKFIRMLHNALAIRREYRQTALEKLQRLRFMIGGPDEIFDEYQFADNVGLYGFSFKSHNIIDMLAQRRLQYLNKYYSVLNKGIANNTIDYYQEVVNISQFVTINNNTIIIPASLLKDSFYNPNLPSYFNFATLGRAVAKEIFNLIFSDHFEFADGDYLDADRAESNLFDNAVECLLKEATHFHNYELKSPKSIKRFLADFASVNLVYEAYEEWSMMHPQNTAVAPLEYSAAQLYWIHSSKQSCNKIFNKHDKEMSRFKIIGPLRSSQHFAKDYFCPEGSRMNPAKRCNVL